MDQETSLFGATPIVLQHCLLSARARHILRRDIYERFQVPIDCNLLKAAEVNITLELGLRSKDSYAYREY